MFLFKECEKEESPKPIIIPMVDVMLFLLAFFVLISGSLLPGITLKNNPPETVQKSSLRPKKHPVTVVVDKRGRILYGKETLTFDQLVRLFRSLKRQYSNLFVVIDADRNAPVQALVTVMDAANKAGVTSIGLLAKEKNERRS